MLGIPTRRPRASSTLEQSFDRFAKLAKLPAWDAEYRFAAEHVGPGVGLRERLREAGLQDWRFDRAFVKQKVFVELEGGVWVDGRHSRGAGYTSDCAKYNAATLLGWRGLRFTTDMLKANPMGCMEKVKVLLGCK